MISVIICKKEENQWNIDTWLMSCRVLGREVEQAALQDIITNATDNGVTKLIGTYIPTERNVIVKNHFKKLGFKKISNNDEKEVWELNIVNYKFQEVPMHLQYKN
jgi:predicted enzyme involved in methoxymalonyl-ACP biosynthesis